MSWCIGKFILSSSSRKIRFLIWLRSPWFYILRVWKNHLSLDRMEIWLNAQTRVLLHKLPKGRLTGRVCPLKRLLHLQLVLPMLIASKCQISKKALYFKIWKLCKRSIDSITNRKQVSFKNSGQSNRPLNKNHRIKNQWQNQRIKIVRFIDYLFSLFLAILKSFSLS